MHPDFLQHSLSHALVCGDSFHVGTVQIVLLPHRLLGLALFRGGFGDKSRAIGLGNDGEGASRLGFLGGAIEREEVEGLDAGKVLSVVACTALEYGGKFGGSHGAGETNGADLLIGHAGFVDEGNSGALGGRVVDVENVRIRKGFLDPLLKGLPFHSVPFARTCL